MNKKTFQTGDIIAYYSERYGVYCPCQVMNETENAIALLFFNHFSKEIPDIELIKKLPLLRQTHHYWRGKPFAFWIDKTNCENLFFIENQPIITPKSEEEFESSDNFEQIDFQYAWQQLPDYIQENFLHFDKSKLAKYEQLPDYLKENLSQKYRGKIFLEAPKSLTELREIKAEKLFSYEIETHFFDENLVQLLAENPIIIDLKVLENQAKTIDVSNTSLQELELKVDGVEKIILNREMCRLAGSSWRFFGVEGNRLSV